MKTEGKTNELLALGAALEIQSTKLMKAMVAELGKISGRLLRAEVKSWKFRGMKPF